MVFFRRTLFAVPLLGASPSAQNDREPVVGFRTGAVERNGVNGYDIVRKDGLWDFPSVEAEYFQTVIQWTQKTVT